MAHSFDKTYLAALGFADRDRKVPEHDQACQYLASPDVALKLIGSNFKLPRVPDEKLATSCSYPETEYKTLAHGIGTESKYEFPLTKGEAQYKVTLGFLDVVLSGVMLVAKQHRPKGQDEWSIQRHSTERFCTLIVEVKITPTPVSEIIRQINFYREYASGSIEAGGLDFTRKWMTALRFDISDKELQMLHAENILVVRLGDKFDAFLARHEDDGPADILEV